MIGSGLLYKPLDTCTEPFDVQAANSCTTRGTGLQIEKIATLVQWTTSLAIAIQKKEPGKAEAPIQVSPQGIPR